MADKRRKLLGTVLIIAIKSVLVPVPTFGFGIYIIVRVTASWWDYISTLTGNGYTSKCEEIDTQPPSCPLLTPCPSFSL